MIYFSKDRIHQLTYNLIMASFKENLRNELDFQGLTVKELSAKTGIIKGTLDNYLGIRSSIPPADIAVKIAKALGVSVEYLVTGTDEKLSSKGYDSYITNRSVIEDFEKLSEHNKKTLAIMIHALSIDKNA